MVRLISQHTMFQLFLLLKFTTIFFSMVDSMPPEDPIMCSSGNRNCTITNAYGAFADRSVCRAADVAYPTTEEELISVVATATKAKRKMKVATRSSHSIPKLVCPDGDDALLISTKLLNRKFDVDPARMTITVDSGVTLQELLQEAAKAGFVVPFVLYVGFFSIGGILGTGSHGSTLFGLGSSLEAHVIEIRIVTPAGPEEGYSKVRTLVSSDPDLKAARLSLGVLGVISQVTIKLEPLFKRSITLSVKKDVDLADQVTRFGYQHEFGEIIWHPSWRVVVYQIDDRVSTNVTGNGVFERVSIHSTPLTTLATLRTTGLACNVEANNDQLTGKGSNEKAKEAWHLRSQILRDKNLSPRTTNQSSEEDREMTGDADGRCRDAKIASSQNIDAAFGLTNNGTVFTGYPVIGYSNLMGASRGCEANDDQNKFCPWDPRVKALFNYNAAFSISMPKVKSYIQDVQKLNELVPKGLCALDLNAGIFMRYVTASTAYLGKQEASVEFDLQYYRSKDPMTPRLYEDILEEIEQIGIFKYGGLPHWGKNQNVAFEGVINKYKNAKEFLKVREKYDPLGLFSSSWTDEVLGLRGNVTIEREGCALEGLCICSKDIHCAPSKGYFCRPGKVYEKARVCAR